MRTYQIRLDGKLFDLFAFTNTFDAYAPLKDCFIDALRSVKTEPREPLPETIPVHVPDELVPMFTGLLLQEVL